MLGRYDERDRNIFTHVEVTRQEHRGQHWHVPLPEVDILIDWLDWLIDDHKDDEFEIEKLKKQLSKANLL
jgi:hypothetical protein